MKKLIKYNWILPNTKDDRLILFFRVLPYVGIMFFGIMLFILANRIDIKFHDLLINISATFFSIPLLYLFYEIIKKYSEQKTKKEIFRYAKSKVDTQLLIILGELQKIVYTLNNYDFSGLGIDKFLAKNKESIKIQLKKNQYLGFEILERGKIIEEGLEKIIENNFIFQKINDDKLIALIRILTYSRQLKLIQKKDDLYTDSNLKTNDYEIFTESKLKNIKNYDNKKFPKAYCLVRRLNNTEYKIIDFGDFSKADLQKCLIFFNIKENWIELFAETIYQIIANINIWLGGDDTEFLIDSHKIELK